VSARQAWMFGQVFFWAAAAFCFWLGLRTLRTGRATLVDRATSEVAFWVAVVTQFATAAALALVAIIVTILS
jgi:hypothetical protein